MLNPLSTLQGLPAKAFVDVGGLRGVDPADGLTAALTETIGYSPGDDITVQAPLDQSVDTVLSMTFVGLSGTGYIFEVGGASTGASAGFQANGDFEIVAGADPCRLVVPAADAPFGTGELTIELTVSGSIRAWWRSITGVLTELHELGTITDAIGTDWTGTGPGRYLGPDGYWDGAVKIGSSIVDTQTVTYTSAGGLRVYAGQTVSIFARGTAPAVADGQSFTVGDAITSIDGSASGANLVFSYAASGLPEGVTINASTGAVTGLPATAGNGTATITATDQFGRQYTDTFTWTSAALPVGIPPNVADGQVFVIGQQANIDGSASGTGLTFTYSLTGVPAGVYINASTGLIAGTIFSLGVGGTATITATDQHGREFTDTFTWTREAAPVISGVPTISGTETEGQTLTATAASVTGLPTPSTTWQWERSGVEISGATSATYTLVADDVGETLTVVQTETNTHGIDTAESAATGTIASSASADFTVNGFTAPWGALFADGQYRANGASSTLANALTHARAGNATLVDSDGVLKWGPHNLLLHSGDLTNAAWVKDVGIDITDLGGGAFKIDFSGADEKVAQLNLSVSNSVSYTSEVEMRGTAGETIRISSKNGGAEVKTLTSDWQTYTVSQSNTNYARLTVDTFGGVTARTVEVRRPRVYRSDLGGMVDNPATGDSYVPTEATSKYLPRVGHHVWDGSAWVNKGALVEEQATNLLPNSATLSTQNVTVAAEAHTLHFTGTGTVTLSGVSTAGPLVGTGTGEDNRVSLSFTPTAGTLTLTVSGTVSNAQLETGVQTSYIPTTGSQVTRAADVLTVDAAKLPWSGTAVSLVIEGEMTYADEDSTSNVLFFDWVNDASNFISVRLATNGTRDGGAYFLQGESGTIDTVIEGALGSYSPGVNVPFSIASRHGTTFINGAIDGAALTANTTPTDLADLSSTNLQIAPTFNGTISRVLVFAEDIGDTGIVEATS